ncbi:MAG TPA: lysylphosphatidylglycerol synthase domain-containing protein [Longimicrobiaceae bacterium]|nr:lysylphosphatidylglycerol synthase domain-containing protein [Longimicrobiaceae bacterium]
MRLDPRLRRGLSYALVAAAFVFLGAEIYGNADQLREFRWEVRPGLLALSIAVLSGVLLWGVVVWQLVLRRFGTEVPFRALARAWFLSNLSRYIPGVVWQFVSLAQLGPGAGLSPSATVMSLLVQMGFMLLSAGILGVYLLPLEMAAELGAQSPAFGWVAPFVLAMRWAAPLALVLVHPGVMRAGLGAVGRATRRPMLRWEGSWAEGVGFLLLSGIAWVLYGLAFYLFLLSFVEVAPAAIPAAIAMNGLAFIVGYLVFFAPGGLGFKEAALAFLLSGLVPTAVAASLAIAARLWTIAAEVLPALVLARRGAAPGATAAD